MPQLEIKKYLIKPLVMFIDVPLSASQTRTRNRVVKFLDAAYSDLEDRRVELNKQESDKDEAGEPKMIDVFQPDSTGAQIRTGQQYSLTPEKFLEVNKKWAEMQNEILSIEINNSADQYAPGMPIKEFDLVKSLLLGTQREFNISDGKHYDELITAFEAVNFAPKAEGEANA